MRSVAITARTATSATSFQMTPPSLWPAKECVPTRWTRPTPKPFGRKVKRWLESRFNGYHVPRKENYQNEFAVEGQFEFRPFVSRIMKFKLTHQQICKLEERNDDETDETRRHFHTSRHRKQFAQDGLRSHATCRPWSLGTSTRC